MSDFDYPNVRVHNLKVTIKNIVAIGGRAEQYMSEVLDRIMTKDVWPRWVNHITLEDHSLDDLRRLGHPYAVRFPVDSFLHPDSEVHRQSGSVAESSRIYATTGSGEASIRLVCTSPHYIFLRYGTRYMRMRDPAGAALAESINDIRNRFADEVRDAIVQIYTS
jgi:hypothetical protein